MKTRNLLLALGCAAALTACTNEDEPAVAPALRTVTLSVEVAEPADTRVAYTEDGTTYKFAWTSGDKLRVFYNDGTNETYADFEIDSESIDGNKADFTGSLPDGFTGTVTIGYSDRYVGSKGNEVPVVGLAYSISQLSENTRLYAENVTVTDGVLPGVKLQHAAAYLLLKSGLKVIDGTIGDGYRYTLLEYNENYKDLTFSSTGISESNHSGVPNVPRIDTEGKLTADILVRFYVTADGKELSLPFNCVNSDFKVIGTATQPARTYMPGVVYEVAADNANWVAAKLSE